MGTENSQPPELITLARLATRAEADAEDVTKCLDRLLSYCEARCHELSESTARTALQAIYSTCLAAISKNLFVQSDVVSVLIEFLGAWNSKSEEIVTESLDLVEVVAKYLHALSYLPACCTPPTISRKLAESQDVFQGTCHRAMVLRTLYSILQYSDVHSCDDQLKIVVERLLKALDDAAASTQDGARFCFQVFAVCCLSPLSDDPSSFPKPENDYTSALLSAAAFTIYHIQRNEGQVRSGEAWSCGLTGHTHLRVEEQDLLIFFGTLPRLLRAFGRNGLASADEAGNTVLHRLANSSLSKCLEIYLHSCGPHLEVDARNKAGLTAAEVAAASGNDVCLDLVRRYKSHALFAQPPAPSPGQERLQRPVEDPFLGSSFGPGMAAVSRAMARASSMPLPPGPGLAEGDSPAPSLSYIEPETSATPRPASQEERLKSFEAQAAQRRELHKPSGSASSLSSVENFRQQSSGAVVGGPLQQSLMGTTLSQQHSSEFDIQQRRRIVELALRKLDTGSEEGSEGEGDKSRAAAAASSAYFQNPAGNLPVHSNPFATFQEGRVGLEESGGSMGSHSVERSELRLPSVGAMRTGSMGSIGLEGSSPPQPDFRHHSLSYDSRSTSGFRSMDWAEEQLRNTKRASDWESANTPSTRMWLGNIAAHVTVRSLYDVFGHFGRLTDAAVFPARIGPLGYAFVNFMHVEDAAKAYDALNNTSVPPLTGSKLLKIRYKPAQQSKTLGEGMENIVPQPSTHLWLGNIPTRPNKLAIEELFGQFGPVTSVRVFPGKTFAFVNYDNLAHATAAMQHLDSRPWPSVSGSKPMVVRYQAGPPQGPQLLDPQGLRGLSVPAALMGLGGGMAPQGSLQGPMGAMGSIPLPQASLGSLGSLGSAGPGGPLEGVVRHSSLPALTNPSSLGSGLGQGHSDPGHDAESLLPAVNLSNRLNPNNMHYDKDLAEMYKNMTKAEKEALWADDRSQQQLLAMQAQDQLPTDLSMLGLPPQQASLLANHLAGGNTLDPWGGQLLGSAPNWGSSSLSSQLSAMQSAHAAQQQQQQQQHSLPGLHLPQGSQNPLQQGQQPGNMLAGSTPMMAGMGGFPRSSAGMLPQLSAGHLRTPLSEAFSMHGAHSGPAGFRHLQPNPGNH